MATLGATYLNLMDLVQREKPDHTVATVAEILNQQNPPSIFDGSATPFAMPEHK